MNEYEPKSEEPQQVNGGYIVRRPDGSCAAVDDGGKILNPV